MKKVIVLIAALLAVMFVVGCASKPAAGQTADGLMALAKGRAPAGTLVGQATVKGSKDSSQERRAEQTAMKQFERALNYIAGQLIDDQSSRLSNPSGFKQTVSTAISRASFDGALKIESGVDGAYVAWAVYSLDKDEALKEVAKAVNAAKEAVQGSANFNLAGFDAKFAAAAAREWKN